MLDFNQMNQVAAYDGFPSRYPHWRFGMEFERLRKSYAYGLHRIYEMVINTEPCYAYLLASNLAIDQKLVMAHVYGHADFSRTTSGLPTPTGGWTIWRTTPHAHPPSGR